MTPTLEFQSCLERFRKWRGGRNVKFQNVEKEILTLLQKWLFSFSQLRNQNVKNGFLVDHYYKID